MDLRSYLGTFLDESREHLQALHEGVFALDQGTRSDSLFWELFRSAHTLKGMSASMGYAATASVTHQLEEVLDYLRSNPATTIDSEKVDTLFMVIDWLETQMNYIQETSLENSETADEVISQLQAALHTVETPSFNSTSFSETASSSARGSGLISQLKPLLMDCWANAVVVWFCEVTITPTCVMKGARAILLSRVIESYGDILGCDPSVEGMQSGEFGQSLRFVVAIQSATGEDMIGSLTRVSEVETVNGWIIDETALLEYESDEPSSTARSGDKDVQPPSLSTPLGLRAPHRIQPIVRIPAANIDVLMNLVSEMVIDKNRLENLSEQLGSHELSIVSEHMSRVVSDLQHAVLKMRMEPVDTLFQRFPRTVRDLGRRLDKQIELVCRGGDTTCDRIVMDELAEVLVHLIRNAADHGIETSAAREASGKPLVGTIALTAYTSGQELYIDVTDDGQGIDIERVRKKAIESGVVDGRTASLLTSREVIELLFQSGFSTTKEVTDISGRGVGLDVVRAKMATLGGTVHVTSEQGNGTHFQLRLPLSLSILRVIVVDIDGQRFAIPTSSVDEVLSVSQSAIRTVQGNWVLQHEGFLSPVIDAGSLLLDKSSANVWPWRLVILRQNNRTLAMVVDKVLGQVDVVHKPLGRYLRNIAWFSGSTILGDGNIALVMNVSRWFDEVEPSE